MHPGSRLGLARLAYAQAIAAARAAPSPRRWRALVTAGKNLRDAERRDHQGPGGGAAPSRPRAPAVARSSEPRHGPVLLPFPVRGGARWAEVVREWERARALCEWSHRLVAASRALSAQLAREVARGGAPSAPQRDETEPAAGA